MGSGGRRGRRAGLTLAATLVACAVTVEAGEVVLEGLAFSDELGGVELEAGWGSGTLDDPFVLVEEITDRGPATLVVRGLTPAFGNRIGSHHDVGFALTKIVRNGTDEPWHAFNLELRERQDQPSPFGDGLSFGQGSEAGRPFTADRFTWQQEVHEPYDAVHFHDGVVAPGRTVSVSFVVTDTTPVAEFYLVQQREGPLALQPPRRAPAALAAMQRWRPEASGSALRQTAAAPQDG